MVDPCRVPNLFGIAISRPPIGTSIPAWSAASSSIPQVQLFDPIRTLRLALGIAAGENPQRVPLAALVFREDPRQGEPPLTVAKRRLADPRLERAEVLEGIPNLGVGLDPSPASEYCLRRGVASSAVPRLHDTGWKSIPSFNQLAEKRGGAGGSRRALFFLGCGCGRLDIGAVVRRCPPPLICARPPASSASSRNPEHDQIRRCETINYRN